MNRSLCGLPILTMVTLCVITSQPALAAEPVKAINPQLTVTGSRCVSPIPQLCFGSNMESRQITLQAAESKSVGAEKEKGKAVSPVKGVKEFRILATELDRKDNPGTISGVRVITRLNPKDEVLPGKFIQLPVQFDLSRAVKSGEFNGSLVIEHSEGDLSIPVTLKLKDSLHWAIIVTGVGVWLAVGLASYQANGFDRDEVSGQVARLRSQIQTQIKDLTEDEKAVAEIFRNKVEALLVDVIQLLEAKTWAESRKKLTEAQAVWSRWRQQRNDWIDLHNYLEKTLKSYLEDDLIPESSVSAKDLDLRLSMTRRRMADCVTPEAFTELLKPLEAMFKRSLEAFAKAKELDRLFNLNKSSIEENRLAVVAHKVKLEMLAPSDEAAYKAWNDEASKIEGILKLAITQQPVGSQNGNRGVGNSAAIPQVQSIPAIQAIQVDVEAAKGKSRMWLAQVAWQSALIISLCGLGLKQLYGANATFGADPIGDYLSLLAFGFSAEVTRDSLSKAIQRPKPAGNTEK
jgi:hypothetical protein